MSAEDAAAYARSEVARVRDDPAARLVLLHRLYEVPLSVDRGCLPYRRAASAFMGWQLRRGLLNPPSSSRPGSPWWRAHNISIVDGYLSNEDLATTEGRVERFFLNVVLLRVLYAHAMVAAPRMALGWLAPFAPAVGDPRVGMTGIFLSLARVLPDWYPLGDDVDFYTTREHGFGRMLDIGVIQPRIRRLYDWSAEDLRLPELRNARA